MAVFSGGVIIVLWIVYAIALFVMYHKVFDVIYFSVAHGIIKEIFFCGLLGFLLTMLTIKHWKIAVAIVIIAGIIIYMKEAQSENRYTVIGVCTVLVVIIAAAGIKINKNVDESVNPQNMTGESTATDDKNTAIVDTLQAMAEDESFNSDYETKEVYLDSYLSIPDREEMVEQLNNDYDLQLQHNSDTDDYATADDIFAIRQYDSETILVGFTYDSEQKVEYSAFGVCCGEDMDTAVRTLRLDGEYVENDSPDFDAKFILNNYTVYLKSRNDVISMVAILIRNQNTNDNQKNMEGIIELTNYVYAYETADEMGQTLQENGFDVVLDESGDYKSSDGSMWIYNTDLGGCQIVLTPASSGTIYGIYGLYCGMTEEEAEDVLLQLGAEDVTFEDDVAVLRYVIDGQYSVLLGVSDVVNEIDFDFFVMEY